MANQNLAQYLGEGTELTDFEDSVLPLIDYVMAIATPETKAKLARARAKIQIELDIT
jgi:hypothetical protein